VDSENGQRRRCTEGLARNERRRIRLLWIGLGTWLFIFLNAIRLASHVPYQIVFLGFFLNLIMIVGIVVLLRQAYRQLRHGVEPNGEVLKVATTLVLDNQRRRIRLYWIVLGVYFLTVVSGLRFAFRIPYHLFAICALLNFAILIGMVVLIARTYRRLRE
jgi:hypothetical protein